MKLKEIKLKDKNDISINSTTINWGPTNSQPELVLVGNIENYNITGKPKGTSSVDFGDINGDGYVDRIERWVGNETTQGYIKVYFYNVTNKSFSNTFSTSQTITYGDYEKFKPQFLFADINNDGKIEIIYTNNNCLHVLTYKYGNLLPFFSDGRGVFNTEQLILDYYEDKIVKIIPKDVNNDSYADIVIGFYNKGDTGRRGYTIFYGSSTGLTVNPISYNINPNYKLDFFDFGDIHSDGKLDLFGIASKQQTLIQPNVSYQIHVNNEHLTFFTYGNDHFNNLYNLKASDFRVSDVDNDGTSDWLVRSSTDNRWYLFKDISEQNYSSSTLPFSGESCRFIDLNGDGLVDVLDWKNIEVNNQIPNPNYNINYPDGPDNMEFFDNFEYDHTEWKIYLNTGNGVFSSTPLTYISNDYISQLYTITDLNLDGISDFICFSNNSIFSLSFPHANHENLVYSVTNGMGQTESVSYKNITEYQPNYANEVNEKVRPMRVPLLVADTHTHIDGSKTVYTFEAPKYHTEGKGFLGFASIKTSNADNNVETTSYYNFHHFDSEFNQPYYYPALSLKSISTVGELNDISYSSQTNSVKVISSALKRYIPYVSILNNTDALKILTQKTTTNYDSHPYSLTQTIETGDITTTTFTTFTGPTGKTPYLPSTVITTRTLGADTFTKKINYSFTFDETNPYKITGKTETVDPGDVDSLATTYSNFDQWGHPQNIAISSNGITRNSSVKYYVSSTAESNAGLYLRSRTNVLEETTNYVWDETTGLLDSETDPRGNTTTYKYTSFGQLQETVYPDGIRKATILQWAGTCDVIGAKYYSYSETSGSAPLIIWFDVLGRQIQSDTYGFDEKRISVVTEYYYENEIITGKRKGMVFRTSEPFFETEASNKRWAKTLTYDKFGRTIKAIIPMGELTNEYNYRETTVSTPESKTITTLNSAGQILKINVNGKTVNYQYYPSGLVKSSTPQDGLAISMAYNKQGKQTRLVDPNSGLIRSEYNGFGELTLNVQKVHASGDSIRTIHTYKTDGRLESINRNGEITTYTYSTTPFFQNRINTIELRNINSQVQNSKTFTYDPSKKFDRVVKIKEEIIDNNGNLKELTKCFEFDELGRLRKEIFPSGYYTINLYDRFSNLTERKDGADKSLWKVVNENAKGQLLQLTKGNKTTTYDYYANGLTKEIKTDGVVSMYYEYEDLTHNLHSREDLLSNQTETFGYDALNRLKSWSVSRNGTNTTHSIVYDDIFGTIKSKSDLGAFTLKYGGEKEDGTKEGIAGGALAAPHALTSIIPNTGTTGTPLNFPLAELNVSYTDFKKISTLSEGSKFYRISYGTDDERIRSEYYNNGQSSSTPTLTRYYFGNYEEEIDSLGNIRQIHYLSGAIMIHENGVETLYFSYTDYQGSLIALTDYSGNVVEQRYAYDPWGVRRNPDNWTEKDSRTSWIISRGYTSHEHLDAFGIINMNGRVYDPLTAQFFSPDPVLTDAGNWLDYNRFGYCLNNPFRYTDPSGYSWWSENGGWAISTGASIIVGGIVGIFTAGAGASAIIASGMAAGAAGGFTGGVIGTSLAGGNFSEAISAGFQGMVIGGMMGGITAGIGSAFGTVGSMAADAAKKFNVWNELGRAGVHAVAQGGFSYIRNGNFWQGAAAGFVSSFAGSLSQGAEIHGWGMVAVSTAMGGVGASIGGARSAEEILFGMVSGTMVGMLNHMGVEKQKRIAYRFMVRREAYDYMYKNSYDANGNPIREVGAWNISDGTVVVLPFDNNGLDYCEWNTLNIYKTKTGIPYLRFRGENLYIEGFIHTHSVEWNNPKNPIGISESDLRLIDKLHRPIQIIYHNRTIYSVDGTYNYNVNRYNFKSLGTW